MSESANTPSNPTVGSTESAAAYPASAGDTTAGSRLKPHQRRQSIAMAAAAVIASQSSTAEKRPSSCSPITPAPGVTLAQVNHIIAPHKVLSGDQVNDLMQTLVGMAILCRNQHRRGHLSDHEHQVAQESANAALDILRAGGQP